MPRATTTPPNSEEPQSTGASLQSVVAVFGMSLITMVVGTALYGTPEQSERAFRLLHWWKRDPESTPDAQRRTPRAKHQ